MSETDIDLDDLERRMEGAVQTLAHEFAGLRTGRASASLLEPIKAVVYGSPTPLDQVGTISVPDARMLSVQVWDKGNVSAVEKAIRESSLGLNPAVDGQLIRIALPELNEERRTQLVKVARDYSEQARVAVRNVRRDGMDSLKKAEKNSEISKDDHKIYADEVQALTDKAIKKVDDALSQKEAEIMQV